MGRSGEEEEALSAQDYRWGSSGEGEAGSVKKSRGGVVGAKPPAACHRGAGGAYIIACDLIISDPISSFIYCIICDNIKMISKTEGKMVEQGNMGNFVCLLLIPRA